MGKAALFISDLHLPPSPSPLREAFARFLDGPARHAASVYILGDLFEVWTGDDTGLADYADEAQRLRALTAAGVPVYFQHGNRDFLVGERFFDRTGVQLLPDPDVVQLDGRTYLISHGDLLCTDDVPYQRWRRVARNPVVQWIYLRLPLALRQRIAGGVRAHSANVTTQKPKDIMDVNAGAVAECFRAHGVAHMIHGHTHRPDDHVTSVDGQDCRRWVLADWQPGRCEALQVDEAGVTRIALTG